MIEIKRKPTSVGEILSEEFLKPMRLTQKQFADHVGCDVKVINRIVNEKTSITAEMALKLAAALGTTPDFWVNAQKAMDLFEASKGLKKLPALILKKAC
jgi:antitoxin HigA-1